MSKKSFRFAPSNEQELAFRNGAATPATEPRWTAKPRTTVGGRPFPTQFRGLGLFLVLGLGLFLAWGALVGCGDNRPRSGAAELPAESNGVGVPGDTAGTRETPQASAVRVRVLRGPSAEIIEGTVAWQAEMTVFDVISRFSPSLDVESTGQGEALFVKSIAGQKNLGSAGDNWIYRVNGQLGDRSCGVYPVAAGDEVVWSFGKYE
jgi:hypothetical protein